MNATFTVIQALKLASKDSAHAEVQSTAGEGLRATQKSQANDTIAVNVDMNLEPAKERRKKSKERVSQLYLTQLEEHLVVQQAKI